MTNTLNLPDRHKLKIIDDDIGVIIRDIIKDYETRTGKTLQPAHIERLLINTFAYRELLLRKQINEAYRQQHVRYATGLMLDICGDDVGTPRLTAKPAVTTVQFSIEPTKIGRTVIHLDKGTQVVAGQIIFETTSQITLSATTPTATTQAVCTQTGIKGNGYEIGQINSLAMPHSHDIKVANISPTMGGHETEDDDSYRERIFLAFERFSVAGSVGAYAYHARAVSADIIDVHVGNAKDNKGVDIGGTVQISLLTATGTASNELIRQVSDALSDDKIRPLCDTVIVSSAKKVDYTLQAELTLHTGANRDEVLTQARKAFLAYQNSQSQKLGVDIVPLNIAKALQVDGVYNVNILSPRLTVISPDSVAYCTNIQLTVAGEADG